MARKKPGKIRAAFRKSYDGRTRKRDYTRDIGEESANVEDLASGERVSGKGRLTRKRTVTGSANETDDAGFQVELSVDESRCLEGRVIKVFGLTSIVQTAKGPFSCAIRGLLKSLATGLQNSVVAGDHVTIVPGEGDEGVIVRVLPRRNGISRTSRGKQQIIVANVDCVLIVASAAEPDLKPNLIDRFLLSVEKAKLQPVIIINKIDLVSPASLMQLVGTWGQLGYPILQVSAETWQGMRFLREVLSGRDNVVVGQSGVGKSSLLNAAFPGLNRRVGSVSDENQKGRHTTTTAELIPLDGGGHLIDTPGIRSLQLWDVSAEEVEGLFRDIRPYAHRCRYPNCTHTHEEQCAVKNAVADGLLDLRRYDSYCQIRSDL